jgi:hypothetical protein
VTDTGEPCFDSGPVLIQPQGAVIGVNDATNNEEEK